MQDERDHQPGMTPAGCGGARRPLAARRPIVARPFNGYLALALDIRHKPDMGESRRRQHAHHHHHPAVIHRGVAAHKDALIITIVGNGGELGHQLVIRHKLFLQIDLALLVDGDRERLAVLPQRRGAGLGQVHRHTYREQRRSDHKDDQQHQHHVYKGRNIDFGHDAAAAAPAPRRQAGLQSRCHYLVAFSSSWRERMAENSSAKASSRFT